MEREIEEGGGVWEGVGGGHCDRMVGNWSLKSYKSCSDACGIIPNSLSLSLSARKEKSKRQKRIT